MKIAIVCSNYLSLKKDTKKGTEIITHTFINSLAKYQKAEDIQITAFASGDSDLPVKIESVDYLPSSADKHIMAANKHIIFELALLSKAFSMQDQFDLYHINIGDGDIALPFAPFVKKPVLITLHYTQNAEYINKYFSLFKKYSNVSFVSISDTQREFFPDLNYAGTIYHGIETEKFKFDPKGGESIMWAGRVIPQKGIDVAIEVAKRVKQKINLFGISSREHEKWFKEKVLAKIKGIEQVSLTLNKNRLDLVKDFQLSKLFFFPIQWEEPFGLVLIESMACGTPVVAYARGSVPEIIKDGETGFIVNSSETDIRGDWVIKKTGFEGLCEAVEKIYSTTDDQYLRMRNNCRANVEKYFTAEKMAKNYLNIYKTLCVCL